MLHYSFLACLLVMHVMPLVSYATTNYEARERVAKLEATVDILTNEVMRLRDTGSELRSEIMRLRDTVSELACRSIRPVKGPCQIEEEIDKEEEEKNQFRLGEIRREEIPAGYRIAVRFWSNLEDEKILSHWTFYDHSTLSALKGTVLNKVSETDPSLKEAYVDQHRLIPLIHLELSNGEKGYGIAVNGTLGEQQIYGNFKLPHLDIQPQRELVYEQGQNASFTMVVEKDMEKSMYLSGTFVDLTTEELFDTRDKYYWMFNITITKTYFNSTEIKITIDTAKKLVSGFVNLQVEKKINNSLVDYITSKCTLIVRPVHQRGPLPEGYLSFYHVGPWSSVAEPLLCDIEKTDSCEAQCMLFGDKITNFTITRTNPEGQMTVIPAEDIFSHGHWTYREFKLFRQSSDATGTGIYAFECTAHNAFGKQATEIRVTRFYKPAQIVLEETRIHFLNNSTVHLTCAVTGDPASTIKFIFFVTRKHHIPGHNVTNPDSVQHLDDMDIATKTLELDDEDELSLAQCYFHQEIPRAFSNSHTY